jgi:hypothetical protein
MTPTILGISYSTRMQGLAIIKSHLLVDYSLKLYKEKWGPHKRDSIISSLASCIKDYNITAICLSRPSPHQQTHECRELYLLIRSLAYQQKVRLIEYTHRELRFFCYNCKKKTNSALMRGLSELYPELIPYFTKEVSNKNKYYIKLFEAVAAATLFNNNVSEWKR